MSYESADVDMLDIYGKWVSMSDGEVLPIVEFYDADGEFCDADDAKVVQAGRDDYGYVVIEILGEGPALS